MPGLQPAGRLRGVLVEGGADEASLRLGNVRWVLGLHPGRQTLSTLAERGRRPLGPGQSLTGTRFPSSAAPPDSKRHARTREECPGLALSDDTHRAPSEPSVGLLDGRCEKNPHSENLFFSPEDSVVITLLTFRVRTAKQKQLMGGASRRGASRLAVHGESTRIFLLSYWSSSIKPVIHLTTQTLTPSEPPIRMEERLIGQ